MAANTPPKDDRLPYSIPFANDLLIERIPTTPAEQAMMRGVLENPDDDLPRRLYADWFDEHGYQDLADDVRAGAKIRLGGGVRCQHGCDATTGCPRCKEAALMRAPPKGQSYADDLFIHGP